MRSKRERIPEEKTKQRTWRDYRVPGVSKALTLAISLALVSALFVSQAGAAGTTAADFLTLGAGARVEAMGSGGTAFASGADAVCWNPAALGRCTANEFSFSHAAWFAEIDYEHVSLVHPLVDETSIAFSSSILHTGGIPRTLEDDYGIYKETDGTFSYNAMAFISSVGRHIGQGIYLGASAKFIYEDNADESAAGLAFDLGGLYISSDRRWSFGVAARNLGRGFKPRDATDPLPSELAGGAAVALVDSALVMSFDAALTTDAGTCFSWGAEHRLKGLLFVRAGYKTSTETTAHRGFTVGAGVIIAGLSIDYAACDYQKLGLVHRFTLGIGGS
jgi:hypothetical protein